MTLYRVDRDVYGVLDWIGDIGGLLEGFLVILSFTLTFISFKNFDHYLVEGLYRHKDESQPLSEKKTSFWR